jgi:hypothetical protein
MVTVEVDMFVHIINAKTSMNALRKSYHVVPVQSVLIFPDGSSVHVMPLFLEMLMDLKDVEPPLQSASMMPTVQTSKDVMLPLENALTIVFLDLTARRPRNANQTHNVSMDVNLTTTARPVKSVTSTLEHVMTPVQPLILYCNASVEQMPSARLRTTRVSVTVLLDMKDSQKKFVFQSRSVG